MKEMNDNNFDKILSKAFHEYVNEQLETEAANATAYKNSTSFDKKINRALKSKHNFYYKLTLTNGRRILCACVIIMVILLSLLSVGAVRDAIAGFFIEHFRDHNSLSVATETDTGYPSKIEKVYVPQFIPDGYELAEEDVSEAGVTLIYEYNEKKILYTQNTKSGFGISLNNEYSTSSTENIDGQDYYIIASKNNGNTTYSVHWDDGEYIFELSAELPKNDILNMCKSLKVEE